MYNKNSSIKYGWRPDWFGVSDFGTQLSNAVKKFQKIHDLDVDGLVGPSTYRRIYTERSSKISQWKNTNVSPGTKSIVYDGNHYPINWERVVLWDNPKGFKATHMKRKIGTPREPDIFVNHWDVCLSSKSCFKVLENKGLSVHFLIDNDGTIYQTMDIQHIAYHCGNHNDISIGVEISNAYYTKYQNWYVKNGFDDRPTWKGNIRGKQLKPHLGFYDVQIRACMALWDAVSLACDIPKRCPLVNGEMSDSLHKQSYDKKWKGFIHRKISKK